jgi:hypothetical protein
MSDVCRWHKAPELPEGRVLVPGCWNRVIYGDGADCHCPKPPKSLPQSATALLDQIADMDLSAEQIADAAKYLKWKAAP